MQLGVSFKLSNIDEKNITNGHITTADNISIHTIVQHQNTFNSLYMFPNIIHT